MIDAGISKIEEYFGRGWTRALLALIYAAVASTAIVAIFTNLVLPLYEFSQSGSVRGVYEFFARADAQILNSVVTVLLVGVLYIDNRSRGRLIEETALLAKALEEAQERDAAAGTSSALIGHGADEKAEAHSTAAPPKP